MIQDQRTVSELLILDEIPAGLVVLARDLSVVHWNSMLERWTGLSREAIVGRTIEKLLPDSVGRELGPAVAELENGAPRVTLLLRRDDPLAPPRTRVQHAALLSRLTVRALGQPCFLLTISAPPETASRAEHESSSQLGDELGIRTRLHEIGIDEDPATMSALLADFVDSAGNLASRLLEAARLEDRGEAASIAHRLAGAAVTLGAKRLGGQAKALETTIEDLPAGELESKAGELIGQVERVRGICRRML